MQHIPFADAEADSIEALWQKAWWALHYGGRGGPTDITDGTNKDDAIAFSVVRKMGDNSVTIKYTGKLAGDTIKGDPKFERDGEEQTREWTAKRDR